MELLGQLRHLRKPRLLWVPRSPALAGQQVGRSVAGAAALWPGVPVRPPADPAAFAESRVSAAVPGADSGSLQGADLGRCRVPAVEPAAQRRPAGRAACGCPGRFVPRAEKGLCVSREAGGRANCCSPEAQVGGREERRQNEETVSPI